jgi:hypothetical protein
VIVNRQELLNTLRLLAPALAGEKNQVKELSHFWFDGKYVSAFNDILGIRIEFDSGDFTGGVNGDHLLGILENSPAKDIRMEEDNGNLAIRAGNAFIKLAVLPAADMLWKPVLPKAEPYSIPQAFMTAVDMCLLSVGKAKVLTPEQRGVTLIQHANSVDAFSTDAVSLSWMRIPDNTVLLEGERCILSTPFCEQLKNIGGKSAGLYFSASSVYCKSAVTVVESDDGNKIKDALLFAKLVEDDDPIDFNSHITRYMKGVGGKVTIPIGLRLSIDRAMVILNEGQPVELGIGKDQKDDDFKSIFIKSIGEEQTGEVDDAIGLSESDEHSSIKVRVDAKILKRGLDNRKTMRVTEDCLILEGPELFVHIIATK